METSEQCLTEHRASAIVAMAVAGVVSAAGVFVSQDYAIPAIMLWVASGILWWTRKVPCNPNRKENDT